MKHQRQSLVAPSEAHRKSNGQQVGALLVGEDLPRVTRGSFSNKLSEPHPLGGDPRMILSLRLQRDENDAIPRAEIRTYDLDLKSRVLTTIQPLDHASINPLVSSLACDKGKASNVSGIEWLVHAFVPDSCVWVVYDESVMALLTAGDQADQEIQSLLGDEYHYVAWQDSPARMLESISQALVDKANRLRGVIVEGLGLVTRGEDEAACLEDSSELIDRVESALDELRRQFREIPVFGNLEQQPLSAERRRELAIQLGPVLRGRVNRAMPGIGRYMDDDDLLEFIGRRQAADVLSRGGASILDWQLALSATVWIQVPENGIAAEWLVELDSAIEHSSSANDSNALPVIVAMPGVGCFVFGPDAATVRLRCEGLSRLVRTMQGAELIGNYAGFPQGALLPPLPPAEARRALTGKVAIVTGGASGIGLATVHRLYSEGACVAICDRDKNRLEELEDSLRAEIGVDAWQALNGDLGSEDDIRRAFEELTLHWCGLDVLVNCAGLSIGKPLHETSAFDYDLQNNVMPRGSFLCSREAASIFKRQGLGGDIVYIASKNALYAGPNNVAYGTAKAAQLHQARLLAVELADIQVRVNVVNPDAVVRGSGIFSHGWGADRAKAYGINEQELGKFYASRSLLKQEMFPEDIAAAVYVLVGPELRKSTGLVINVDGGFAPSMVR